MTKKEDEIVEDIVEELKKEKKEIVEEEKPIFKEKKEIVEEKKEEEKPIFKEKKEIVEEKKEEEEKPIFKEKKSKKKKREIKEFSDLKPEEVKEIIIDLVNKGKTKSNIGIILREQYGVPKASVILKKSIGQVLAEEKITQDIPEDLMSLIRKNVSLKSHLGTNKKDFTAKRGYELSLSKIRRLVKYYKKNKKLSEKWIYTDEIGALLVK